MRGDIREQADREAALIIREARAEAERIIEDARAEVRRMEDQLDVARPIAPRVSSRRLRMLVERHLAESTAAEQSTSSSPSGGNNGAAGGSGTRENGAATPAWMGSIAKE